MRSYDSETITKRYYHIGEVCDLLGVAPSCARFWIKTFGLGVKRGRGAGGMMRLLTAANVEELREIHRLLEVEMFTIEGAKRQLAKRKAVAGHSKTEIENVLNPMP